MEQPVELHIERTGSGPPIVLAHGFGGSARNFRKQVRALEDAYSVVTYDARGHARSARSAEPAAYGLDELRGDLARVAESTGALPVIGGVSLGAYTALAYALSVAPAALRGVVLAAYPAQRTSERRVRWATEFAQAIEEHGLDAAGARFVWGPSSRFDANSAALIRLGFLEHSPTALAAILRSVLADVAEPEAQRAALERLTVPVLLVAGSEDPDALAAGETLASILPNAEKVIVPGAGHLVNLQGVGPFNAALRSFLDRVSV